MLRESRADSRRRAGPDACCSATRVATPLILGALALGWTAVGARAAIRNEPQSGTPYEEPEVAPQEPSLLERMASTGQGADAALSGDLSEGAMPASQMARRVAALRRYLQRARGLEPPPRAKPLEPFGALADPPPAAGGGSWVTYAGPFQLEDASHLFHRTMIGGRIDEIERATLDGHRKTVSILLKNRKTLPAPPGSWATEPFPDISNWSDSEIDSLWKEYWDRRDPLRLWWARVMLEEPVSAREPMVLFWHDHFATGISKVALPQSMYVQNQLFRKYAMGNFKTMVKQVAIDPAMLIWLDGIDNRAGHINENWGRELLELFTMGVGNYTQNDVVAAARAFTGWTTIDGLKAWYVPAWHDNGMKTFLGRTGRFNGNDIIDIIFDQPETARFLCRKLYRYFIDEYPDEALVEELAATLRANNYEVRPVLRQMFESDLFMGANYRGAVIADPVDRLVGAMRSLYVDGIDFSDPYNSESSWLLCGMWDLGQVLFEPPNVGGWPGYRTWLNAETLPLRKTFDIYLIEGWFDMQVDVMDLAYDMPSPDDAERLVDDLSVYLFGLKPTESVRQRLLAELLQGAEPWEWSLEYPEAETRIRDVLRLAVRLPDYQLK